MTRIYTRSAKETKNIAQILAWEARDSTLHRPVVIALEGELGAGKTTFSQGFAKALGVKENVLSPTFVLMKFYAIPNSKKKSRKKYLVHVDCYRLDSPKELMTLGLSDALRNPEAIILIEWADRIKKSLPRDAIWIRFRYGKRERERVIEIEQSKMSFPRKRESRIFKKKLDSRSSRE